MAENKSFRLEVEELAVIERLKQGGSDTDGLKRALRFARHIETQRERMIEEVKVHMKLLDISFEDLGADYKAIRQEEGRELLRRLRQGLKKQGKKMLPEILEAECRRYGVELRGGNTGVQTSQTQNTYSAEIVGNSGGIE